MIFLAVLALATAAVAVIRRGQPFTVHTRIGLAIAMAFAGAAHLFMPTPFVQHLPDWVPARYALIYVSGLAEIGLGAALVWRAEWRRFAGLALAAYLLAVFPSNIYVAVAAIEIDGQPGGLYAWLRLPLQPAFVWLALWSTGATDVLKELWASRRSLFASYRAGSPASKGTANA